MPLPPEDAFSPLKGGDDFLAPRADPPVHGMMAGMTLRMCLLAASAGLLLNQVALGCRHHRPSFGPETAFPALPAQASCSADRLEAGSSAHFPGQGQPEQSS
jgi:hypothetical protein